MRNLTPSSAVRSKAGAAEAMASRRAAESPERSGLASRRPRCGFEAWPWKDEVHDAGNNGPALSSRNAVLRKWSRLACLTSSSASTSSSNFCT